MAWYHALKALKSHFECPLNTDRLTLGQHDVYFKKYPGIKWCVDHLDDKCAYLGLYNYTEKTAFGFNNIYNGSIIAAKCAEFLNNVIPGVAQYLEPVTVNGVTNKVFIPSGYQFSGKTGVGDNNGPVFDWPSASEDNRMACVSNWDVIDNHFWLSSPTYADYVWCVDDFGSFYSKRPLCSHGFRPEVKVRYKRG